jgi:hypothetical protein
LQQATENRGKLPGQVRAFCRVIQGSLGRDGGQRDRFRAAAADLFFRQRLIAGVLEREVLQLVGRPGGIEQIARDHRVEIEAS